MKQSIRLDAAFEPIVNFIRRFHTIIFFMIISGGLFVAILMLLSIIDLSTQTATTSDDQITGTFDQATINQVENLDNRDVGKPGSRPSPFVEP